MVVQPSIKFKWWGTNAGKNKWGNYGNGQQNCENV